MNELHQHTLRRPTWTESRDAGIWVVLTLGLGLLPLWGGAIIRFLFDRPWSLADFVVHGEFALYTASIVSGTVYILCREYPTQFPFRPILIMVTVLLALWSGLISGGMFLGERTPPSAPRVAWLTIPAFVLAMIISVLAMLLDQQVTVPDPHEAAKQQEENLRKRLRSRRKKSEEDIERENSGGQ